MERSFTLVRHGDGILLYYGGNGLFQWLKLGVKLN